MIFILCMIAAREMRRLTTIYDIYDSIHRPCTMWLISDSDQGTKKANSSQAVSFFYLSENKWILRNKREFISLSIKVLMPDIERIIKRWRIEGHIKKKRVQARDVVWAIRCDVTTVGDDSISNPQWKSGNLLDGKEKLNCLYKDNCQQRIKLYNDTTRGDDDDDATDNNWHRLTHSSFSSLPFFLYFDWKYEPTTSHFIVRFLRNLLCVRLTSTRGRTLETLIHDCRLCVRSPSRMVRKEVKVIVIGGEAWNAMK